MTYGLIVSPKATVQILEAKAWRLENLGSERAQELDDALAAAFDRIQAFPRSAERDWFRGAWSDTRRRLVIGRTGHVLRYRLHDQARLIEIISFRHQAQRPLREREDEAVDAVAGARPNTEADACHGVRGRPWRAYFAERGLAVPPARRTRELPVLMGTAGSAT